MATTRIETASPSGSRRTSDEMLFIGQRCSHDACNLVDFLPLKVSFSAFAAISLLTRTIDLVSLISILVRDISVNTAINRSAARTSPFRRIHVPIDHPNTLSTGSPRSAHYAPPRSRLFQGKTPTSQWNGISGPSAEERKRKRTN
jgi:hypothetical protein